MCHDLAGRYALFDSAVRALHASPLGSTTFVCHEANQAVQRSLWAGMTWFATWQTTYRRCRLSLEGRQPLDDTQLQIPSDRMQLVHDIAHIPVAGRDHIDQHLIAARLRHAQRGQNLPCARQPRRCRR